MEVLIDLGACLFGSAGLVPEKPSACTARLIYNTAFRGIEKGGQGGHVPL